MRFKYLTATMLREAAMRIYEKPNYICWTLDEIAGEMQSEARSEFESVLRKMEVTLGGWLNYHDTRTGNTTNHYAMYGQECKYEFPSIEHPEMIEMRVMFLLMLADAIAYKTPKKQKFDGSNKPFTKNPSEPGVYAVVNFKGITHYSKWDGKIWFMTAEPLSLANKMIKKSIDIYHNQYSHWINTKLL